MFQKLKKKKYDNVPGCRDRPGYCHVHDLGMHYRQPFPFDSHPHLRPPRPEITHRPFIYKTCTKCYIPHATHLYKILYKKDCISYIEFFRYSEFSITFNTRQIAMISS